MNGNNKRTTKLVVLLLVLCLLVGATVGGTLAWLVTQTDPVVNTFTVGNINITLTETGATNNAQSFKMVPGADIDKDPTVTVKAGSEPCWLFVKVQAVNTTDFLTYSVDSSWTLVGTQADGSIVYGRAVAASGADQTFAVLTDDKVTVLNTVTKAMMDNLKADNLPSLTFTAYAIQSANLGDHVDTAAEAWTVYQSPSNP